MTTATKTDLSVTLAGLELKTPLMSASGTFGHGLEMGNFVAPETLGAWVSKTVTLLPRHGNPAPRICETEAGFLNSIGLENRGVEDYEQKVLPTLKRAGVTVITNIGGATPEEFVEMAARLDGYDEIHAFEVNLSCPNVQGGKLPFATDPATAELTLRGVREATTKPLFAKLSPNLAGIGEIAKAVEAGGADGITAVNTLLGMSVDWRTQKPGLALVMGGYSGVAVKPVALRCAWNCATAVKIPIIGCGGITTAADVLEFLVAGCTAVQIGTASFSNPSLLAELPAQLEELLADAGVASVAELIGSMKAGY
ncbi:MAG: dihydroorotate dehydrogenase [Planctomycetota bacterium]|jgi:dihydroorotate dehydrogenase (NAD+) catalytic subunit|nr:dihydroorotate dehydrogenase [Planctomycetota bacterium]